MYHVLNTKLHCSLTPAVIREEVSSREFLIEYNVFDWENNSKERVIGGISLFEILIPQRLTGSKQNFF